MWQENHLIDFLTFAPECCDADQYLGLGSACAATGQCYDSLRPLGAVLWFSLPYRLDLDPQSLIILHWVLGFISVALSVFAGYTLLCSVWSKIDYKLTTIFLMTVVSIICHTLFLYPTFFVSLTDTPASLFILIGIWLLLIVPQSDSYWRFVLLAVAGLCLGLAVWLRVFFLYPVLGVLAVSLLACLFSNKRKWSNLILLLGLLPISLQVYTTWKHTGHISYLDPDESASWTSVHLRLNATGYDTVMNYNPETDEPFYAWLWYSSCENYQAFLPALQTGDIHSIRCLFFGKLNFYLGSYSSHAYHYSDNYNLLLARFNEDIGNNNAWELINLQQTTNVAAAPDGTRRADLLMKVNTNTDASVRQWLKLYRDKPYVFSVWLWSDEPQSIVLAIKNHENNSIIAEQQATLSSEPVRYLVSGLITKTDIYDVSLTSPVVNPSGGFYAWGSKLEQSLIPTEFKRELKPMEIRTWSYWILTVNSLALILFLTLCIRILKHLDHHGRLALMLLALISGQALMVVPEQRFAIAVMIAIWIFCLNYISWLALKSRSA